MEVKSFRKKYLCLLLVMVMGMVSSSFTAYALGEDNHKHTDSCYDTDGKIVCGLEEETLSDDEETDAPEVDDPEVDDPEVDASEAGAPETDTSEEDASETDTLETDASESDISEYSVSEYSDSEYGYIQELLMNDESVSFNPETQSVIVIDVSTEQSKFLKELNIENAETYIHDYDDYWFQVKINGNLLEEGYPYYYIDNDTHSVQQEQAESRRWSHTWWEGVVFETTDDANGVIALIVDRDAEYEIYSPTEKWYYTHYYPDSADDYTGSYGFVINPLSSQDAFGYNGKADSSLLKIQFNFEWDLVNDIIGDIAVANSDMRLIDYAGYTDIDTKVTLKVEIRDADGNISLLPKRCYHIYSSWDHMKYMEEDGILVIKTTSDDHGENKYGEFDFQIPIGYDYRITVLDYGEGLKDYAYAYNWNQEYESDDDGFCIVEKDIYEASAWGTAEELLFMPKGKEIRIEKKVENPDGALDQAFTFQAMHLVPTYTRGEYISATHQYNVTRQPDKKNVLSNYYYELYDGETDEPIPSNTPYKTDNNGCFDLKAGQYAIFKTWETPADIAEYTDYSRGFEDILNYEEMPTETSYIFEEITKGDFSTTITHITQEGEKKIDGSVAENVVGGDKLLFTNIFPIASPTGDLVIKNTVSGDAADENKLFTYTVTLDDLNISGSYGDVIFNNGVATFTLKHGESKRISGLPANVKYTVVESNFDGYDVSVDGTKGSSSTGVIVADDVTNTIFNNYNPDMDLDSGSIKITKTVKGDKAPSERIAYEFKVWIRNSSGTAVSETVPYSITKSDGATETGKAAVNTDGYTFSLKDSESIIFSNITADRHVEIQEITTGDFTTTTSGLTDGVCVVSADSTKQVEFINDYGSSAVTSRPKPDDSVKHTHGHGKSEPTSAASITAKEPIDSVPATGDSSDIGLWIGLIGISFLGIAALTFGRKIKR